MHFDILHSDVQTSLILSTSGHKYYVLYLDDYSNFCGLSQSIYLYILNLVHQTILRHFIFMYATSFIFLCGISQNSPTIFKRSKHIVSLYKSSSVRIQTNAKIQLPNI